MNPLTPDAVWVLWRTFIAATLTALYLGAALGVEWTVPMFTSSALLYAGILCWIRVGVG